MLARNISLAKTALDSGGVVMLPTETVYGIAARADMPKAVSKIYDIKGRNFDKPLAVCVKDIQQAQTLALISPLSLELAQTFWPGPLTLVLPIIKNKPLLSPQCYQNETIALRCPDINWRGKLLDYPLALTSANESGKDAAIDAHSPLNSRVDYVLDGGPSKHSAPSTIISITGNKTKLLRQGVLSADKFAPFDMVWQ